MEPRLNLTVRHASLDDFVVNTNMLKTIALIRFNELMNFHTIAL